MVDVYLRLEEPTVFYFQVLVKTMHCSGGRKVLRGENETNLVFFLVDIWSDSTYCLKMTSNKHGVCYI